MNRLNIEERARIIGCLVEGNSMRATARLCGVSFKAVNRLLLDVGMACDLYQNEVLRNLPCKRIQCDEVWAFVGMKEKNVPKEKKGEGYGDIWTWTGLDSDSKLMVSWLVGRRSTEYAKRFIDDLAGRLAGKVQLTTDAHRPYLNVVEGAFAANIDYAILHKIYRTPKEGEHRYSPGVCCGTTRGVVCGNPDEKHISTSHVERQNLTMRMGMRRMTRLTNAFSKKVDHMKAAVALHFMYYNFGRIHKTLRVTPAMEAGISQGLAITFGVWKRLLS